MFKFIFALLLLSTSAVADDWRPADTYRETAFQVLNVIDWGQTRYIARHPDQFYEKNLANGGSAEFIGVHPTTGRVDVYMAQSAVLHFAVAYLLPHDWRDAFQYITIAGKLNATVNNASIGIKVGF